MKATRCAACGGPEDAQPDDCHLDHRRNAHEKAVAAEGWPSLTDYWLVGQALGMDSPNVMDFTVCREIEAEVRRRGLTSVAAAAAMVVMGAS